MQISPEIKWYVRFFRPYRGELVLAIGLAIIQTCVLFPLALFIRWIFDEAIPTADSKLLLYCVLLAVSSLLLSSIFQIYNKKISYKIIKRLIKDIRFLMVDKILIIEAKILVHGDIDQIRTIVVQDTERVDNMSATLLSKWIPSFFIILGLSAGLLYLNSILFLALLVVQLFVLIIAGKGKKTLKNKIQQFHKLFAFFEKSIQFLISYNSLIRFSSAEKDQQAKNYVILEDLMHSSRKVAYFSAVYTILQSNLFLIGGIIVLFLGSWQVILTGESIGALISFYVLFSMLNNHLRSIIDGIPAILEGTVSLKKIMPFCLTPKTEELRRYEGLNHSIQFENVIFGFGETMLFNSLNVTIEKNKITAIFGASGSGKSTLVKLLLGNYTPLEGLIRIDGVRSDRLDMLSFRKKVGFLAQYPQFFSGSVFENLCFGLDEMNINSVIEVCKCCRIHGEISTLADGYETDMGNNGERFSGGQKQRLALARAILRKPDLLILDEPENHLEEKVAMEILSYVKQLKITTLIISHHPFVLPVLDIAYRLVDKKIFVYGDE